MNRDNNSSDQESNYQSKKERNFTRDKKSKANETLFNQESYSTDNSDFIDQQPKAKRQAPEQTTIKLFSDISKTKDVSPIRNKNKFQDSDNYTERSSSPSSTSKEINNKKYQKKIPTKNINKISNLNDDNIRIKSGIRPIRTNKSSSIKTSSNSEKKKKKTRKKYIYSSNHSNINLKLEKSFELEVPQLNSLASLSRRKNIENQIEVRLPERRHSTQQKKPSSSKTRNNENKSNIKTTTHKNKIHLSSNKNNDFIQVGSGDDMKIIFNVSKYYTDLGEKIANEVIFDSLKQVKHHDIILDEDEISQEIDNNIKNNDQLLHGNINNKSKEFNIYTYDKSNEENEKQNFLIHKDHNNKDFMVVGTGNDLKVILNISKYYNDLGEIIANEVIEKSLSQVKHHGILSDKEKILNDNNNYVFNYHDDQSNNDTNNNNQEPESFNNKNKIVTRQFPESNKAKENDNFIQVGSGDDMKIIFNVSKYYTDLGEKIANEVIFDSLKQVKHHDIILDEDEISQEIDNNIKNDDQLNNEGKNNNQQNLLINEDHNNKDFMVVGTGNDLKVILNISKYYNDLGEIIANEVIEKSLSQVKHHGILSDKEKILNDNNNYVFNYHDDQSNNDTNNNNQESKSFNQNHSKSSSSSAKTGQENNHSPNQKIKKRRKDPNESRHDSTKDLDSSLKRTKNETKNSDSFDSSLTNVVKMVPVSEEDVLPLDDEMIPNSKPPSPTKTSKQIKDKSPQKHKKSNHIRNDLLHTEDDLATLSESREQTRSKNNFISDNFMSSDLDAGEKKKSKIVVIKTSNQHRKSSNLDTLSESEMQSGQPSFKKRPINLLSSHSQITNSFENLKSNQDKSIRKAKSTNILPFSSSLTPNNDSSSTLPQNEKQHLPPVQSPRNMKNYLSKQSSSQTLTINRGTKNNPLYAHQKSSLNSSDSNISKSLSTDITISKDFDDSSSAMKKKKVNSPISPIASSNPFNELQNSHK